MDYSNAIRYPVQIQADNEDANDSRVPCMCHVFDYAGFTTVFAAMSRQYRHVLAWDANGAEIYKYDNR